MSYQLQQSIGKDPAIKDLSQSSIPGRPPTGYRALRSGESGSEVGQAATEILNSSTLGDQVPFTIDGEKYMGRSEPHYHSPPPPGTDPSEYSKYPKPWGWHRGVTIFKAKDATNEGVENYQPDRPTSGRLQILQRIDDILNESGF